MNNDLNDPEYKNEWGKTALMLNAFRGDIEGFKRLIDAGANIEAKDLAGNTALRLTAYYGVN